MNSNSFHIAVKTALIQKKMTMTELAGILGISVGYLSEIVLGKKEGAKYRNRILEILDIQT